MAVASQSTSARSAKDHAKAVQMAGEFFAMLAKSGELPITPEDFERRVKEFFTRLEDMQNVSQALTLAALNDELCPIALFKPWASYSVIRQWSMRTDADRLETQMLNGKLCVRPSAFFAAFKKLGRATKEQTAA